MMERSANRKPRVDKLDQVSHVLAAFNKLQISNKNQQVSEEQKWTMWLTMITLLTNVKVDYRDS